MKDREDLNAGTGSSDLPAHVLRRRQFLAGAAATGALVWTAPMILSRPAHAATEGGTPKCQPTGITVTCAKVDCQQGQKFLPGVTITAGQCQCAPVAPKICVRIANLTASPKPLVIYRPGVDCSPDAVSPDPIIPEDTWVCLNPSTGVFFGPERNAVGAIDEVPTGETITFTLGVWASCPGISGQAFICETFQITITWTNNPGGAMGEGGTATCTFTDPAVDLCTGGATPPCTCP